MKRLLAILLSLPLIFGSLQALAASPAELISDFRLKQGEGRVTMDSTLNRIALDQAKAMAAKAIKAINHRHAVINIAPVWFFLDLHLISLSLISLTLVTRVSSWWRQSRAAMCLSPMWRPC